MRTRIFLLICFFQFTGCVNNENTCFKSIIVKEKDDLSLFFINGYNDKCEYNIGFSCSDGNGKLKFNQEVFYMSTPKSGYQKLFSLKDAVNSNRNLIMKETCLQDENKTIFRLQLKNKLHRTEERVLLIRMEDALFDDDLGYLDYNFFLSSKFGLLGNYLSRPENKGAIYQVNGDILEKNIDYSEIKFLRIR